MLNWWMLMATRPVWRICKGRWNIITKWAYFLPSVRRPENTLMSGSLISGLYLFNRIDKGVFPMRLTWTCGLSNNSVHFSGVGVSWCIFSDILIAALSRLLSTAIPRWTVKRWPYDICLVIECILPNLGHNVSSDRLKVLIVGKADKSSFSESQTSTSSAIFVLGNTDAEFNRLIRRFFVNN